MNCEHSDNTFDRKRDATVERLRAENERLRAENDAAWDAVADLEDYLTPGQIHAELLRKGIDTSKAIERVMAALRARKGG
jgi:hypothetical protein